MVEGRTDVARVVAVATPALIAVALSVQAEELVEAILLDAPAAVLAVLGAAAVVLSIQLELLELDTPAAVFVALEPRLVLSVQFELLETDAAAAVAVPVDWLAVIESVHVELELKPDTPAAVFVALGVKLVLSVQVELLGLDAAAAVAVPVDWLGVVESVHVELKLEPDTAAAELEALSDVVMLSVQLELLGPDAAAAVAVLMDGDRLVVADSVQVEVGLELELDTPAAILVPDRMLTGVEVGAAVAPIVVSEHVSEDDSCDICAALVLPIDRELAEVPVAVPAVFVPWIDEDSVHVVELEATDTPAAV